MNLSLAAHGPDDSGFRIDRNIGFGHRLRRFTPEDRFERQPLPDREGLLWVVCDGRIDNRRELTRELNLSSSEAAGLPDSAFVLRAWERWGSDCVRRLIGAYAFAVYDERNQTLVLARSPRGENSCYYAVRDGVFAFATAPKALFALPFFRREINLVRLADALLMKPNQPDSTFYAGIQSLPPGHTMLVRRNSLEIRPFWNPAQFPTTRFPRDEDYVEAFSALFDRAVEDSLRAAPAPGIMLSGGFDSASTAAVAATHLERAGHRLVSFTEVPEGGDQVRTVNTRYPDETPFVDALARKYPNLEVNYVRTHGKFFLDGVERFFEAAEVPFRNASNRVWMEAIEERASSRGIGVLLTGMIGNLTMSWDGRWLVTQLIRQGRWPRALQEANGLARAGGAPSTLKALIRGLLPLLPESVWLGLHRLRHPSEPLFSMEEPWRAYSPIRSEFFSEMRLGQKAQASRYSWQYRPNSDSRVMPLLRPDVGADIMRGSEAMFGVRFRAPANDQRIVDFCLSIPEEQFLHNGKDRWLIRRAMTGLLPDEILGNKRRGLQAADWLSRLIAAKCEVTEELDLLDRCEIARHTIDLPAIRSLLDNIPQGVVQAGPESLNFRGKIETALMTGRFLRWIDSQQACSPI